MPNSLSTRALSRSQARNILFKKLKGEAEAFCRRVESGEVRSTKTYAAFKSILQELDYIEANGKGVPRNAR